MLAIYVEERRGGVALDFITFKHPGGEEKLIGL
jgi:hypothetical protein